MLRFISIENFALIERLEIPFQPGFNLISGETGSGKSILVDAVSLLTGARASQEMIRQGFEYARVEGLFELEESSPVNSLLREAGLDVPGNDLTIRREILASGANRIFVNGRVTLLSVLSGIGRQLVDILGQHSQQALLNPATYLEFLDRFATNDTQLDLLRETFQALGRTRETKESILRSEQERLQRIDLIRFQMGEIDRLGLREGAEEELRQELALLATAEKRLNSGQEAYQLLYEADNSIVAAMERVRRRLNEVASLDARSTEMASRLQTAAFELDETSSQLRDYLASIEFDPRRLEQVQEKLAEIDRAKRKYGESVAAILRFREAIEKELGQLESNEIEAARLATEESRLAALYRQQARILSQLRRKAASELSERVQNELTGLAMKGTHFQVGLLSDEDLVQEKGIDTAEFLISPNPGEEPKQLSRIASGGELSRIMLALKAVLKGDSGPSTLVFDEVDSGIGGRAATTLGERLAKIARSHQVFCVTHLPQIAAFADQHFHVGKSVREGRTVVQVTALDDPGRIDELSRMLAGEKATQTSRIQAAELLEASRRAAVRQ